MKKVLFLSLAASAVLASCSNEVLDSVVPQEPQAISFDNAFVDNGTRAVNDINGDNIQNIFVYGSVSEPTNTIFTNTEVTKDPLTKAWTYTDVKFWEANKNYLFIAYSDGGKKIETTNFTNTDGTLVIENYTVADKDLVVSNLVSHSSESTINNPKVAFTLGHALAKVKFTITNNCGDGTTIDIKNLTFSADKTGTYTTTGYPGKWSDNTKQDDAYTFEDVTEIANTAANAAQEFYVIPQSTSDLTASFTATLKAKDGTTKETQFSEIKLTVAQDWKQGYFYNYTASLTPAKFDMQQITFDVNSVKGWENKDVTLPGLEVTPASK